MRKLLAIVYGVASYGFFSLTWAYFIGFLGGFPVPKSIDSGPGAPCPRRSRSTSGAWRSSARTTR